LTVFTGGSDKNGDAIPTWTYQSGSIPPNKDDISNVYAAAGEDGDDTIFYFGLERTGNNGSGHVDFEFLHSDVGLNATGTDSNGCPSGHFTGSRQDDDILLSLNFENDNSVDDNFHVGIQDIRVWDEEAGSAGEYVTTTFDAADIALFQNEDPIVCTQAAGVPWDCRVPGGETTDALDPYTFVEGYINVTQLLGAVTRDVSARSTPRAGAATSTTRSSRTLRSAALTPVTRPSRSRPTA
jgi:hypothetical protein